MRKIPPNSLQSALALGAALHKPPRYDALKGAATAHGISPITLARVLRDFAAATCAEDRNHVYQRAGALEEGERNQGQF